jgi:CBS domain containing-hemolysin-like protein
VTRDQRTAVAVAIAFLAITSMHIVLGEQTPKIVALQHTEPVALYTTRTTELLMRAFWPLIAGLNRATTHLCPVWD